MQNIKNFRVNLRKLWQEDQQKKYEIEQEMKNISRLFGLPTEHIKTSKNQNNDLIHSKVIYDHITKH